MNVPNPEQHRRAMQFYIEGMRLFQTGDYSRAIDCLHNCIQLLGAYTPDYVFFNLGSCDMYLASGKPWQEADRLIKEAIAAYTDAYQRNPYQPLYTQAIEQANQQYTILTQWQVAQLYAEGEHRLESGEYASAVDRFQACADLQGPNVSDAVLYNVGLCKMHLSRQAGDNEKTLENMEPLANEAIWYFMEAQKRNPQNRSCQDMINTVRSNTVQQLSAWQNINQMVNEGERRARIYAVQKRAMERQEREREFINGVRSLDEANKRMWESRRQVFEADSAHKRALMNSRWHNEQKDYSAAEREMARARALADERERYAREEKRCEAEYQRRKGMWTARVYAYP
jgi:hypothetical protein